jgi:hypothetical protein
MSEVTPPCGSRHVIEPVLRNTRMSGRALTFAVISSLGLGCVTEEPLGPPPKNMTGPVAGGSTSLEGGSESESGDSTDTGDTEPSECDPLADPVLECGPGMRCDLVTKACVETSGMGVLDEPCEDTDGCRPGLVCQEERCREPCDPTVDAYIECEEDGQVCTHADAPLPGLCREPCNLLLDNCSLGTDACKRGLGPGAEPLAVCIANPGAGVEGDPCEDDSECYPGFLCTLAGLHTFPCVDDAAACCAPICDTLELPCFGLEPICHPLEISDQESTGFCGAG